jgi:amidase
VASGEAEVALGSDTGGSIRVPSACCGTVGLKTTYGRVPLDGVRPLAPSLDTVGPMATTVAGVALGMGLLELAFRPAPEPAKVVGRLRTGGHPDVEAAIDEALGAAGLQVVPVDWDGLEAAGQAFMGVFFGEIWDVNHELVDGDPDGVGPDIAQAMALAGQMRDGVDSVRQAQAAVRASLARLFERVELLALPTLPGLPPRLDAINADSLFGICIEITKHVAPFNVAGTPATAQPVPLRGSRVPASLQLVGPHNGEELLVATAAHIEATVPGARR